MLCGDPNGEDILKRTDLFIGMADSLCYTVKTDTVVYKATHTHTHTHTHKIKGIQFYAMDDNSPTAFKIANPSQYYYESEQCF